MYLHLDKIQLIQAKIHKFLKSSDLATMKSVQICSHMSVFTYVCNVELTFQQILAGATKACRKLSEIQTIKIRGS